MNLFFRTGVGDCLCGLRGFTREIHDRMDVRTTGMEWAPEFVIKAAQLGARMTEIPIILWPDKRGRPSAPKSFQRRLAQFALHVALRAQLAFSAARCISSGAGLGACFLAIAGAAAFNAAHHPRHSHNDFRRDFHSDRRANYLVSDFSPKSSVMPARFDRNPISLKRLLRRVKLEHGLLLGAFLALAGFAGDAWVFAQMGWQRFWPAE